MATRTRDGIKSILLTGVVACSNLLVGCQTVSVVSPRHPYDDKLLFAEKLKGLQTLPELERQYYTETDAAQRRALRDRIVFSLLEAIEEYQRRFNSNLFGRSAAINTGSEVTAAALAGAAALVDASGTSQLLAGLGAFVIGANASFDKNFLSGRGVELIINRMDSLRIARRAKITKLLRDESAEQYPLGEALLDVQDYARAGSIPAAVQAIAEDNAAAAEIAAAALAATH
jgi:hypothetical protein